jgi:hypothetical protein
MASAERHRQCISAAAAAFALVVDSVVEAAHKMDVAAAGEEHRHCTDVEMMETVDLMVP